MAQQERRAEASPSPCGKRPTDFVFFRRTLFSAVRVTETNKVRRAIGTSEPVFECVKVRRDSPGSDAVMKLDKQSLSKVLQSGRWAGDLHQRHQADLSRSITFRSWSKLRSMREVRAGDAWVGDCYAASAAVLAPPLRADHGSPLAYTSIL